MSVKKSTKGNHLFPVDPSFDLVGPLDTQLCRDVWKDKYQWQNESWDQMCHRVASAIYIHDLNVDKLIATEHAMGQGLWMPAGRILAGAGTPKRVTLLNCFVSGELEDDMASIAKELGNLMLTSQQGGGVGTDFTPLRPPRAILRRTGSVASGPGPFLDTWNSAAETIKSAGDRRAALMGTLGCWHPFLPEFIISKHEKGRWTNFNVSVLITDAFMAAVEDEADWLLYHSAEPAFERPIELKSLDFEDDEGVTQYVYSIHNAADLWDQIIRSTYEYAEPGVIFIDRMNDLNNLQPWEHLQCTNPCGEQCLPPHGCCDLGAVVLCRMVKQPFTDDATFDFDLLREIVKLGIRFLDNVIDVTNYPLSEQRAEEMHKRRIGLGVSGLADTIHMLGMRYGSVPSCRFTEDVMHTIATTAYEESLELAKEKGCAPIFGSQEAKNKLADRPFAQQLPQHIRNGIRTHGLRNGVLLTIAPTGTTSIAYGNVSSGLEPVFAHSMRRKVRQGDGSWLEYDEVAYGARLYLAIHDHERFATGTYDLSLLPSHMNTCDQVKVHEHVRIQEVCQRWVDASISKTINVPEDIDYVDFKDVYRLAYDSGCKGCTTYRPSDVRGSILSTGGGEDTGNKVQEGAYDTTESNPTTRPVVRPEILSSQTIKVRWPGLLSALYLTVGWLDGEPYEVFINSKDQKALEWTMALTILMSMALRAKIPMEQIAEEFEQVHALEGGWADDPQTPGKQRYWPSLIAYLGHKMRTLQPPFDIDTYIDNTIKQVSIDKQIPEWMLRGETRPESNMGKVNEDTRILYGGPHYDQCPDCKQYGVTSLSGCLTCGYCGWSKC